MTSRGYLARTLRAIIVVSIGALLVTFVGWGQVEPTLASSGPTSDTAHPTTGSDPTAPASRTSSTPTSFASAASGRTTVIERTSRVGVFGPAHAVSVANLTVTPGVYVIRFSFEARADSAFAPGDLRCGLVDNNGVDHFIFDDPTPLTAGRDWVAHSEVTTFSLGDVTLGIKCQPVTGGFYRVSFRNVNFWAQPTDGGAAALPN